MLQGAGTGPSPAGEGGLVRPTGQTSPPAGPAGCEHQLGRKAPASGGRNGGPCTLQHTLHIGKGQVIACSIFSSKI